MLPFTDSQIEEALLELPGWSQEGEAIVKTYEFGDFPTAMAFMASAVGAIDTMDHHPEWTNVYSRVDVRLTSHDVGGVTDRDLRLATTLEGLAG